MGRLLIYMLDIILKGKCLLIYLTIQRLSLLKPNSLCILFIPLVGEHKFIDHRPT